MTGSQIVIRTSPVALLRHKPPLSPSSTTTTTPTPPRTHRKSSSNVGEVVGGTTAGCFVVCCCCPCVLVEFLFLAVYKVPASFCRRIWGKRRLNMVAKKERFLHRAAGKSPGTLTAESCGNCEVNNPSYGDELSDVDLRDFEKIKISIDGTDDAVELDTQMWEQFQNAGFWRSASQRHL